VRDASAAEPTARETEVLRLIAEGYTNKEIAGRLALSVKTVETHKSRSMRKLGLQSRAEVVQYALRRRWLRGA
jgi:DNA-binding NarL/FixJ family response regulator